MSAKLSKNQDSVTHRNRLHSLCPYFAMFPESFVRTQLERHTTAGDLVFDPFSGRGTTVLEALLLKRRVIATDINPVAYVVSAAKARIPRLSAILREIDRLDTLFGRKNQKYDVQRQKLPAFFRRAFYNTTLAQVLFLRETLHWQHSSLHRFIAALVLGSLHGEMDKSSSYFSNQMPRTISTKPEYSLRYWRENHLWPRQRDVFAILRDRATLRLSGDVPARSGAVHLADARRSGRVLRRFQREVKAVITSPPYLDVTRYEEDQWLRLWFLGQPPYPTYGLISKDDRHSSRDKYWKFLAETWAGLGSLLAKKAVIVCRIGAKEVSLKELQLGLESSFTSADMRVRLVEEPAVSKVKNRQTDYFQPGTKGCRYEADFVFSARRV